MDANERELFERRIKALTDTQEYEEAATVAIRGYGPEVLGFLLALADTEEIAQEVFAQFSENLWKGLAGFSWNSTFRTWAYTLARNAHHRHLRDPHRRRGQPFRTGQLSKLAEEVRTQTSPYVKTEVKDRFTQLREALDPDDQALLILRVDRRMSWKDVARVLYDPEGALPPKELTARAAALRKRFERVKARLRQKAQQEGLLE